MLKVRLGHATKTSARVCLVTDTTGSYDVTVNGVTVSVALDTGVAYGTGLADFTGLTVDTSYAYTVTLASVLQASGTLRTNPADDASFYVGFGSCSDFNTSDSVVLYNLVQNYDIRAFFGLGDLPYVENGDATGRWNATTILPPANDLTNVDKRYGMFYRHDHDRPAWDYLCRNVPFYKMWSDHDCVCNSFDHDLTATNATLTAAGYTTAADQAAVDAAFTVARTAFQAFSNGNPANTSPLAVAQKPEAADAATPASNYPPLYYSVDIGSAKFHVIDCLSHISVRATADDATKAIEWDDTAKTMLGLPQMRWLKSSLAASDKAFNPIMSDMSTYNAADVKKSWQKQFPYEFLYLTKWIFANARGVVWGTGDNHIPFVASDGTHVSINACPMNIIGQDGTAASGFTLLDEGTFADLDWHQRSGTLAPNVVGLIHVTPTHLDWIILENTGAELVRYRQLPNANYARRIS